MLVGDKSIIIRPFNKETDFNFVISTWLHNYLHSSANFTKYLDCDTYFKYHHEILENILNRSLEQSKVAVFEKDPNIILGFLVFEQIGKEAIMHYIYVKPSFRQKTISKELFTSLHLESPNINYTHLTKMGVKLKNKLSKGSLYNPYFIS